MTRATGTTRLVSVVVPYFERADQLHRLLTTLGLQTLDPERFEVVIADDGSPRAPEPGRQPYAVRVVRQPDLGFRAGAARNLGARAAQGEVIVFLDQDCVPAPTYLEEVAAATATGWNLTLGRRRHVDLDGWGERRRGCWTTRRGWWTGTREPTTWAALTSVPTS